jgi:transcriptional regulator with XRE-family HTH domain
MPRTEYAEPAKPRPRVNPPHIGLAALRNALGLKQADVLAEMETLLGRPFTAGALSGIERGHRGASPEVLGALEVALGLRAGDLVTDYEPGHSRLKEPA